MMNKSVQEILNLVEKPSRYMGNEINISIKDHSKVELNFVLAFPDMYDIGTSHFGIQILYHILNKRNDICAERVFSPAKDMESVLREKNVPIFSLESKKPLNEFDIIGFSLLYELNYTGILTILDLSGIPFLSKDRKNKDFPLIIAGGPCTFNPEPVADIFDAIVIGDGEDIIEKISDIYIEYKNDSNLSKDDLLKKLSLLEGIYIPSFFEVDYNEDSIQQVTPKYDEYKKIKKTICMNLSKDKFPDSPVLPYGKPVHDRLRLEISRGCSRGCRFCQAGMIYRPVRERKCSELVDLSCKSINNTGYDDISLLSLSTGDYSSIYNLMANLSGKNFANNFKGINPSLSLPSIRAGKLTPEIIEVVKSIKKTGFTIAPEAGSQRLRDVINKGLTEDEILKTSKDVFDAGWSTIKLYFMIGLPGEEKEDIEGIIALAKKIRNISNKKRVNINVSISVFVPKPHTPFQWHTQISEDKAKEKLFYIKDSLKIKGVTVKFSRSNISYLEGIWSRGDRKLTKVLINAFKKGCRFDGWNEFLEIDKWNQAFEEEKIDTDFYLKRSRKIDENLPWDHIDSGIDKNFLIKEFEKSKILELTEDCKTGKCSGCGVCDFKNIKPVIDNSDYRIIDSDLYDNPNTENFIKISVKFEKTGLSRFFGHLELMNIVLKSLKRSGLIVKYTNGYNPKPKLSFLDTLPLGIASLNEFFIVEISKEDFEKKDILIKTLNKNLPSGLKIKEINKYKKDERILFHSYLINFNKVELEKNLLNNFKNSEDIYVEKKGKNGRINEVNLKEIINYIEFISDNVLSIKIDVSNGPVFRPELIIKTIFNLTDESLKKIEIIKQ